MRPEGSIAPVLDDEGAVRERAQKKKARYPSLYQINTRVMLSELTKTLGRPATLDDIPDTLLDQLASLNFDWVWFLGVWQTGSAGRRVSRENPDWRKEFQHVLPDVKDEDICGSCFAITDYQVHTDFGGNAALGRLRSRLHERGLKLLLDFVPNHTALDHPWVKQRPEFYIAGSEDQFQREPQNYARVDVDGKRTVLAYGRDPYFAGWPDTLQLNYAEPSLQSAMIAELGKVSELCDGVRCDMAMLILPDVFQRTWGKTAAPFWPKAIETVRSQKPEFLFMAEVYWDLEWTLQQQGFDYTYDKRLYDRLRDGRARAVREHFGANINFQERSARFLENHDEPRAAATFPADMHRAAAVLTFLCPGLRFFHDGQFDGRQMKVPVHLCRRPEETADPGVHDFYVHLFEVLKRSVVREGSWQLLPCDPAWAGNWTSDCFVCFAWETVGHERLLVAVNYAPNQSQCYLRTPIDVGGQALLLQDLMSPVTYDRNASDLLSRGLYLDMPAWGYHVFRITRAV
jgi:hypothetical protein